MWKKIRYRMNNLWVRLSFSFALVILIGTTFTAFVGSIIIADHAANFDYSAAFTSRSGPVENLANYYRINGSWEGIELVLSGIQSFYVDDDYQSVTFSLADESGYEVFSSHPENLREWPGTQFDLQLPIIVNGIERGRLRALGLYKGSGIFDINLQNLFNEWLSENLARMLLIGAAVGILSGMLVSRELVAPLNRLVKAAQAIGSRDLSRRVEVNGSNEIAQLANAFNTMAKDLERGEQVRRNLVADVAHELRTPLTVLQGNLRAILDDVYPLTKDEVAALYDQTRLLHRLVNDLHDLAQAEANKLSLVFHEIDLAPVLYRITGTFSPLAELEGVSLRLNIPDTLPVWGDEARLAQVFHNLLTNALHHTPAGGQIIIDGEYGKPYLWLDISDTGIGVKPEHLPHIFERFYRASKPEDVQKQPRKKSLGLGLAISKAIVEAHKGEISVRSPGVRGYGTTFSLKLPMSEPALKTLVVYPRPAHPVSSSVAESIGEQR